MLGLPYAYGFQHYVVETARFVASLRGCSAEEVAQVTAANAARLFGTMWLDVDVTQHAPKGTQGLR